MQRLLDEGNVSAYLIERGILREGEECAVGSAGDGNINWVRRVRGSAGRSCIVKQARDALEKFPQYRADTARLIFEARYMEVARPLDSSGVLPAILHFDEANRILVLQDLGTVPCMGEQLDGGADLDRALAELVAFLARVHRATSDADLDGRFQNDQMRRLHGDHIFALPFRENDFELAPEVAKRASAIWCDTTLVERADRAYRLYLEARGGLVHADVQSSNVLIASSGPVLLDAEIAHVGDPAFDLGTLVAHVYLPALTRREVTRAETTARLVRSAYAAERPVSDEFSQRVDTYAAIEMIRRTIGAARVECMNEAAAAMRCLDFAEPILRGERRLAS